MNARTEPEYDGDVASLKRQRRPKLHESHRYLRLGGEKVPFLICTSLNDEAARKAVTDRAAQIKAETAGVA